MTQKTRYSDEELQEFKTLILEKLAKAQAEFEHLRQTVLGGNQNDVVDTSPTFKTLEEGLRRSKKNKQRAWPSQRQFINHLQAALVRIENKTYGICRVTGKLIPKERLRAVPHATLGIDAKINK